MSRSKRVFRLIQKRLSGVVLCKDMLVVPPTEHIVRGFLLETTTEKNRVYLWRVVAPLYRPMSGIILNYSDRIPKDGEVYIDRDDYEKSADRIRAIISGRHIEYLQGIRRPQDFLEHASWIGDGSPILNRLDRALTHYLLGNVQQSTAALRTLDEEVDQLEARQQQYIGPLLKQAMRQIDKDPADLTALLDEWENQNVERFALGPSRLSSDRPRLVVSQAQ
jgi:hypothetical protein